ncbi:hypothetical protein BO94DRAFT_103645 [Aspergillus sclerotioniger CBS 115572]|uniref:Uncharacterized protein n=1 Tax=Aspergillus sclerotioniger CBS 115572 TaxID=1450535 RepID=A0A317WH60_9EURO|nr:hypothetical protein BO94DRAFT_103645 [Aspergillus sclerotioniger CBS 115572]PWY84567.1 hypothetical protein BO94DRAFT_103645 [Aspergillus sclerotioniger CBS 115572]
MHVNRAQIASRSGRTTVRKQERREQRAAISFPPDRGMDGRLERSHAVELQARAGAKKRVGRSSEGRRIFKIAGPLRSAKSPGRLRHSTPDSRRR